MYKFTFKNAFAHLRKILKHKKYVAKYCFMCRLYLQGILHDMSKFSPTEFIESVRYYVGTSSPIDACKKDKGYSMAWFHHRGRNKHHWEFWVDDFEKGTLPKKMPFKYALEMVCDFLGAGEAYLGDKYTFEGEFEWWYNKRKTARIHRDTIELVDLLFASMEERGVETALRDRKWIRILEENYENKGKD